MTDTPNFPLAVAVSALTGIKLIDGGDTVDVRFTAADGRMIAVLIPRAVFVEMQAKNLGAPTRPGSSDRRS